MKHTLFKLFLTALLLVGQLCMFATEFTVDGIKYEIISDNEVNVVGTTYSGEIAIPSSITYNSTTYSVTRIGWYAFYSRIDITSVTIPGSVTSILGAAFRGCTSLTSVDIPNSMTYIGEGAFYGCTGLTSISIPNSVTYIGVDAFSGCTGLTKVHISDITAWCRIQFTHYSSNPLYYAHHLYLNGEEVTSLTIPYPVTSTGDYAFYNCTGLTSVTIPDYVTSIGNYAFYGCTNLPVENNLRYAGTCLVGAVDKTQSTYILKEGTRFIGGSAFSSCIGLISITIPNSVTKIESAAFKSCTSLSEVIVEKTTPYSIISSTFNNAYSATLYVPSSAVASYQAASYWSNFSDIRPISLTLDQTSIERNAGDTQALVATVVPASYASRLTWESSDAAVATVSSDGTVTAVGAGTATITTSLPSGATATCSVLVYPGPEITDEEIADIDIDTEFINNHIDIFEENEFTSLDITRATSIEDEIVIPVNDNCIIYAPDCNLGNTKNVVVDGVCDNLVISEGQKFAPPIAFTATNASYSRTNLDNAWGTVCLPYEVSSDDNVTYYTAGTISGDVLTLTSTETLPAGTPAIYKSHSESGGKYSLNANATNVVVVGSVQTESVTTDDITLVGSFEKTVIDDVKTDAANEYYYINGGQFWHATKKLTINPFRAYFTVPKSVAPSNGFSIAVDEDDVTALSALTGEGDTTIVGIYSIDGKPQNDLQTGLNIVKLSNGKTKKILIK